MALLCDYPSHGQCGGAERFIQRLEVELIWTRYWESLEELRKTVIE